MFSMCVSPPRGIARREMQAFPGWATTNSVSLEFPSHPQCRSCSPTHTNTQPSGRMGDVDGAVRTYQQALAAGGEDSGTTSPTRYRLYISTT